MIGPQKRQRPLIRYAGSAAETSIDSKPIGSEFNREFYFRGAFCQDFPLGYIGSCQRIISQRAEPRNDVIYCFIKIFPLVRHLGTSQTFRLA